MCVSSSYLEKMNIPFFGEIIHLNCKINLEYNKNDFFKENLPETLSRHQQHKA